MGPRRTPSGGGGGGGFRARSRPCTRSRPTSSTGSTRPTSPRCGPTPATGIQSFEMTGSGAGTQPLPTASNRSRPTAGRSPRARRVRRAPLPLHHGEGNLRTLTRQSRGTSARARAVVEATRKVNACIIIVTSGSPRGPGRRGLHGARWAPVPPRRRRRPHRRAATPRWRTGDRGSHMPERIICHPTASPCLPLPPHCIPVASHCPQLPPRLPLPPHRLPVHPHRLPVPPSGFGFTCPRVVTGVSELFAHFLRAVCGARGVRGGGRLCAHCAPVHIYRGVREQL